MIPVIPSVSRTLHTKFARLNISTHTEYRSLWCDELPRPKPGELEKEVDSNEGEEERLQDFISLYPWTQGRIIIYGRSLIIMLKVFNLFGALRVHDNLYHNNMPN